MSESETGSIVYRIKPKAPKAHVFEVNCLIPSPDPDGQVISFATWIPGSYMVRDFAKHVVRLWAHRGEVPVAVEKQDKSTWRCAPGVGELTISCEVYAWDLSVRGAHLDMTHGYFNGTSVFPRVHGKEDQPCIVEIQPPDGEVYEDWRVATAMTRAGAAPFGFGRYRAADYDELMDHPVEMGCFSLGSFEAEGVIHDVAIYGRLRADIDRLLHDLKTVCEQHIRFFGDTPPMNRYVFLVMALGEGYGGLEHRASTSLMCKRDDLPRVGEKELSEGYRSFLGLASHEYFHTWNVKRIKPRAFIPYDLTQENYTRLLWAFEGITSYYDDLALIRSGLITAESYLELLGQMITRVWRAQGRYKQSVAESSFDAWTKFYKQDENSPNAIVSYYTKGALVALALDLTLRRDTGDQLSLDDVMRALWQRYGKIGEGVPEEGVESLVMELSGLNLKGFFDTCVHGTADPPLAELLAYVGVEFMLRPAESNKDKGGKAAGKAVELLAARPTLGVQLAPGSGEAKLAAVFDGSAAQAAGLSAGDVVIAVEGLKVTAADLEAKIAAYPVGATLSVHAFRRDELMEVKVTVQAPPNDTCVLKLRSDVDEATLVRRAAWLGTMAAGGF